MLRCMRTIRTSGNLRSEEMLKKLRQLSDVLPDMLFGIFLYGILCQIIGLFFVEEKLFYSIGLWIGIILAMAMAIHMAWSLGIALSLGEDGAIKMMQKHNLLRYGVVVLILGLLMVLRLGNPLSAFLGIMGLKVAAYLQPFTHKLFRR